MSHLIQIPKSRSEILPMIFILYLFTVCFHMMRSELNWWFGSRHLWRASLPWCWLQVSVTEGAFRGSSDCSLLMPAAHPVQWIRGKSSASRLNTSLDKTTSHCYLAAQNFLTLLPSWWKLYNPVLRGKQSCWVLVVGLFISLACFYIAGVYSWLAWYFKENSCEFEGKNPARRLFLLPTQLLGVKLG